MSDRITKNKQSWRTLAPVEEGPEQLPVMPVPVARSALAELVDAGSGARGRKKKLHAPEARFSAWPKDREEVLVLVGDDVWLPGYMDGWHMESRDGGEFGGARVIEQVKVHDVRLQPEKAQGLSASLRTSLPHYVRVESLDQLRRP